MRARTVTASAGVLILIVMSLLGACVQPDMTNPVDPPIDLYARLSRSNWNKYQAMLNETVNCTGSCRASTPTAQPTAGPIVSVPPGSHTDSSHQILTPWFTITTTAFTTQITLTNDFNRRVHNYGSWAAASSAMLAEAGAAGVCVLVTGAPARPSSPGQRAWPRSLSLSVDSSSYRPITRFPTGIPMVVHMSE